MNAARRLGTLSAVVAVLAVAGTAHATTVPSSSTPLAGSAFQGGDGDQDDAAPYVDWQGFQARGRAVHAPDPNAQDSAFVGGAKEDEPGTWDLTTEAGGVDPPKSNILDGWSAVDQLAAQTFLYLALTREASGGTTYVAFELNQDARLWNNGRATIPCRRTGDVLALLAAHGNAIDMVLERWVTSATDASTGCATRGHLTRVSTIAPGDAQGAVNAHPIAGRLPGFHALGASLSAGLFGEVALNMGALLDAAFDDRCFSFGSIWMHSRSSLSEQSNLQDYVAPRGLAVRTCAASGTKFLDRNANGTLDDGEPGLPRFLIWADYDNDGLHDAGEPFAVTDKDGHYVIAGIQPPAGSYTLRETLVSAAPRTSWVCSHPRDGIEGGFSHGPGGLFGCGWGPIDAGATPNASGRNFGNWLPARLTVEKELWPPDDPGRFDLAVDGKTVLPSAGDGDATTIALAPGSYDVTEAAVPPTDPAAFRSTVACRPTPAVRRRPRAGTGYAGLVLRAGDRATCTFTNVRRGAAAIAIEKVGPRSAIAGERLRYRLYVTNPGDKALRASRVRVTDRTCDGSPVLVAKSDGNGADGSPATLDPGDVWTYRCSRVTAAPTGQCVEASVTNAAVVTAAAGRVIVRDDDAVTTTLRCPGEPSVAPSGVHPPPADRFGAAGLRVPSGCISRAAQVRVVGTRMALVAVRVDGQPAGRATPTILQRGVAPLARLPAPGRRRLAVSVAFARGSGAPPLTLARNVAICRPPRPHFTG